MADPSETPICLSCNEDTAVCKASAVYIFICIYEPIHGADDMINHGLSVRLLQPSVSGQSKVMPGDVWLTTQIRLWLP